MFQPIVFLRIESHDTVIAKPVLYGHITTFVFRVGKDGLEFFDADSVFRVIQLVASKKQLVNPPDLIQTIFMDLDLDMAVIKEILAAGKGFRRLIFGLQNLILGQALVFEVLFLQRCHLPDQVRNQVRAASLDFWQIMPCLTEIREVIVQEKNIHWTECHLVQFVLDLGTFAFPIDGRENDYTWSNPYLENKQVFVVKSNSSINNVSDLSGKTVETQKNSTMVDALNGNNKTIKDKFANLTEVTDFDTAFKDLKSGSCDAVAMDSGVAEYDIKNSNASADDFKILNETIKTEKYGVGFKKGNDALKDKVQTTLDEMFKDGTVAKIADKYGISQDSLIQPK